MTGFLNHITNGIGWRERPGDGPVLVALHGIGSEASGFDKLADLLPDWRVIAWEAPGYGPSVPLRGDWPSTRDYADALLSLLNQIELAEFHLVGHSLGTLIGAAFASMHPERVNSLVLASCAQGAGVDRGAELPAAHIARISGLASEGAEQFAESRAPKLLFAPEDNPHLSDAVVRSMSKVRMPGYGQAVRMLASGDLAADCAKLSVPTAVIVGAQDVVTPPEQSIRAHDAISPIVRGPILQIDDTGHAISVQSPEALAALIEFHAGHTRTQKEYAT